MIAANKRLLKATLTEGVLGIQINLIQLYQSNLSAVATQAALIGGFAFAAIGGSEPKDNLPSKILSYFYYFAFTVCFCAAIFALSQATIVVMFGPSMALKADDSDAVRVASEYMRQQQSLVFSIGVVSITAMFAGSCILSWAIYELPIAAIVTVVYLTGYYTLFYHGAKAFEIFLPAVDVTIDDNLKESAAKKTGLASFFGLGRFSKVPTSEPKGEAQAGQGENSPSESASEAGSSRSMANTIIGSNDPLERIKLKAKGVIWKRKPLEKGGNFVKVFLVLEKGKVDFYESEQHYINHENPINPQPIKLWQHNLESDPRKFARNVTSLRNVLKSAVLGNEDFYVSDLMSSEYDLAFAAKNFKFALIPKISSELVATEITELLAHDEKSFKQWIRAFTTVCDAYDEIAATPSIEHTMRAGTSDVETVVQAANLQSNKFN